jgi:hypothetical protein
VPDHRVERVLRSWDLEPVLEGAEALNEFRSEPKARARALEPRAANRVRGRPFPKQAKSTGPEDRVTPLRTHRGGRRYSRRIPLPPDLFSLLTQRRTMRTGKTHAAPN